MKLTEKDLKELINQTISEVYGSTGDDPIGDPEDDYSREMRMKSMYGLGDPPLVGGYDDDEDTEEEDMPQQKSGIHFPNKEKFIQDNFMNWANELGVTDVSEQQVIKGVLDMAYEDLREKFEL